MSGENLPAAEEKRYDLIDPDVRLMLKVRDGNAAAFEELVERWQTRLIKVLEHLVSNRDAAEDLAQEVFLRVYRARASYQPTAKFATWLFKIADNVAFNARRVQARRMEVQLGGRDDPTQDQVLENIAKEPSRLIPTRKIDQAEMADMVALAIQSLSERQRMAVLLSKFEHMSYHDVAAAMDLSPQAVKSLLSRARSNLRDLLEPYMRGGHLPAAVAADAAHDLLNDPPVERSAERPPSAAGWHQPASD